VEEYVKTNFLECFNNKLNKIIGYGSITDGTYKLEVHILDFEDAKYSELEIKKGDNNTTIHILNNMSLICY